MRHYIRKIATEPLAIELYRRYIGGETKADISADLGIPNDRVQVRLDAAARFLREHERAVGEAVVAVGD